MKKFLFLVALLIGCNTSVAACDSEEPVLMDSCESSRCSALRFPESDAIQLLESPPFFGQDFTIEAWVRPIANEYPSDLGFVFHSRSDNPGQDISIFFHRENDRNRGRFGFQVGTVHLFADGLHSVGMWHHVAASFSNGEMIILVDGVRQNRMDSGIAIDWERRDYFIGRPAGVSRNYGFTGDIDEVRFSDSFRYPDSFDYRTIVHLDADEDSVLLLDLDEGDVSDLSENDIAVSLLSANPRWIPSCREWELF